MALIAGQREDRTGGRATDTGQRQQVLDPVAIAADASRRPPRGAVQVAGPGVVAETRPEMQHLIQLGGSPDPDISGKCCMKRSKYGITV